MYGRSTQNRQNDETRGTFLDCSKPPDHFVLVGHHERIGTAKKEQGKRPQIRTLDPKKDSALDHRGG
jgi:hypothetical protein